MRNESSRCLKRIIAAALVLLTVSGAVPAQPIAQTFNTAVTVSAAETTKSGTFSNDVKQTFDSDEKLTVSSNGEIPKSAFDSYNYNVKAKKIKNASSSTSINLDLTDDSLQGSKIQILDKVGGDEVDINEGTSYVENGYVIFSDRTLSFEGADVSSYTKKNEYYRYTIEDIESEPIKVTHVPDYEYKNSDDESQLLQRDKGIINNENWVSVAGLSVNGVDYKNEVVYGNDYAPIVKDQNGDEFTTVTTVITYAVRGENSYSTTKPSDKGEYTAQAAVHLNQVNYYLKKDFTIIAKNIATCAVSATPDGKIYDGSEVTPVVEVKDGEKILEKDTDYTVEITPKTNVGVYTITVTGIGNYTGTNSDDWSIDKANMPELTIEGDTEKTYDGKASIYTVKNAPEGTKFTYEYFKGNESIGENAPKDAGSYTLKVTAENENYNNGTAVLDFVINKKAVTLKPNAAAKTYGEVDPTAFEFTADGIVADTDKDLFANAFKIADGHSENVGTYDIVLADPTTVYDNYTVSLSDNEDKFEITKKALTADMFSYDGDSTFVYDGTAHTVAVKGNDSGVAAPGTALTSDDYTVGDTQSATNAGEYSVTVTAAENGNYEGTVELSGKWSIISKSIADSSVTIAVDPQNKTYDGQETTPVVTVTDNGVTLVEGDDYTLTIASGKNVGEYDYEVVGKGNYKDTVNGKWSIVKSDVADVTVNSKDKTYDGVAYSDENITVSGLPSDFNPSYSYVYKSGSDTLTSAPSNAGSYTVVVTVKDKGGNYNDVVLEKTFEIAKRNIEIYPDEFQTKVYGQPDPTLTFDVETAKDNGITGLAEGDSKDIFNNALALENDYDGTVGFWDIVLKDDFTAENYVVSYTDPVQFEVTPKNISEDYFSLDNDEFTYDSKKKTVKVNFNNDDDEDEAVLTENDFDTAGTFSAYTPGSYTVEIKGQGNYTGTVYLKWTIKPNTDTTAATNAESYIYDGTAHEVSVTANDDKTLPEKSQITYEYYAVETNEDGEIVSETKLDAAPVNAGYYKVQGVVTARGYEIEVTPAYFTISKKQIVVTVNAEDLTFVYDSEEKEIGYTYDDTLIVDGDDDVEVSGKITVGGDHTDVKYDDEGNIAGYDVDLSGLTINSSNYELVLPDNVKYFVTPRDIEDTDVQITKSEIALPDVGKATVEFKVVVNGKELVEGKDYDAAGTFTTIQAGTYNVQVAGIRNYSGIALADWSVVETNDEKEEAVAAIEDAASLLIEEPVAIVSGGKNRVGLTVKGSVSDSDKYTITKTGVVYYNEDNEPSKELTLDNVDGTEIKQAGKDGKTEYKAAIYDADYGIYARGYITVTDGIYTATKYTDVLNASYAEINAKKALYDATQVTISEPVAVVISGKNRVGVIINSNVNDSDKYTIVRTGLVYYNAEGEPADELVLDNVDGTKIKKAGKDGKTEYAGAVYDAEYGVYVRGYVTVTDGINTVTKYTDVLNASYAEIEAGSN